MKALAIVLGLALLPHEALRTSTDGRTVAKQTGFDERTRIEVVRDGEVLWSIEPGYALAAFEVSSSGYVVGVRESGRSDQRAYYAKVFGPTGELRLDRRFLLQNENDPAGRYCATVMEWRDEELASTYLGVEVHDALRCALIRRDQWRARGLRESRRELWLSFPLDATKLPDAFDPAEQLDRDHPLPEGKRMYVLETTPIPCTSAYVVRSLVGKSLDGIEGEVVDVVRADGQFIGTLKAPPETWSSTTGVIHSIESWTDTAPWRQSGLPDRLQFVERGFTLAWFGSDVTTHVEVLAPRWPLPVESLLVR
ncbi:MAG: hypothetical protein NTV21_08590 [Planctomycetota bacterium]|nr:hypothetical protein [Planctomycetota bacterium]